MVNNLHHKAEKKSALLKLHNRKQTLMRWEANRLRKNLCQDLSSGYEYVILSAVAQSGSPFKL